MSQKIKKVIGSPKENVILIDVLRNFGQDIYVNIVDLLMKDPDITDDKIFIELASREKKVHQSFNKFKLAGVLNLVKHIIKINPYTKILDFGGANCLAAQNLAETNNLKSIDVCDIVDQISPDKIVKFSKIELDEKLPYLNKEFDVVFCMMTLHHIKNVEFVIQELSRITKKYLIIQEHDADTQYTDILDIIHGMYIFVKNDADYEKVNNFSDFQAWYKSMTEWTKLLDKYFSVVWIRRTKSPQNNYFALYIKK